MLGYYTIGREDPHRTALVDPDERTYSFGELVAASNRYSHGLRALGLGANDTVALILPNGVELVEVYGAAIQVGMYTVALNWHLSAPEISYILENSGARAVVAHERFGAVAAEAVVGLVDRERCFAVGGVIDGFRSLQELGAGQPADPPDDRTAGQATFYTSGTTGRPKGVRKNFGTVAPDEIGLASGIGTVAAAAPADDWVVLVNGPMYHAAPIAYMATGLDSGATVVLMDRWTPERFLDLVQRYRVNQSGMVPTMFHRLLSLPDDVRENADVSSIKYVLTSGAACPPEVKRRMIEWFGPIINEAYSATEGAGTTVTAQEWLERPGTVGRPSPGVVVRILDADGNDCPPNVPGRVFLSQTMWKFEYLGDPDKTSANRIDDMFTVGDIGYLDEDGYLFLCDRDADIIVRGGVNIYPIEIEGVLLEHPAVADAVVVGAPNDEWGEEVRAVVELKPGVASDSATVDAITDHCRTRLARYKCPTAVDFVDTMPRDPNGKVRKQPIRDRYWHGRTRRI
ncbi:MAG: AMP-binding protein [Acidimicrobiia bacterium]